MTTDTKGTNGHDVLQGGKSITLSTGETVFIREVTPADILEGNYIDLLKGDVFKLLDWITGHDEGWSRALSRDDWTALREAEEAVNFEFALAETTAAHARGQRLKFVDEQIAETSERLLRIMGSFGSSANTAASPDPRKRTPAPNPSDGSKR